LIAEAGLLPTGCSIQVELPTGTPPGMQLRRPEKKPNQIRKAMAGFRPAQGGVERKIPHGKRPPPVCAGGAIDRR